MANSPARNKKRYMIWIDRDLHRRWMAAHEPGEAAPHLVALIEAETARLETLKAKEKGEG